MDAGSFELAPLGPVVGAEVRGIKLTDVSTKSAAQLRQALLDHQVLFFRDQPMTLDEQKSLGRLFGELHIHPAAPAPEGHKEVLVVHADERSKTVAGYGWHSDVSCDLEPPMASILRITQVPNGGGGDTLFSSMYAAYEALSDPMQRFLSRLVATHSSRHVYQGRYGVTDPLRDGTYPKASHPVVRVHPETGRKCLYVNSGFTTRIEGLSDPESRSLLSFLFAHVSRPEFQCRFRWEPESVAFWDNRCVQHLAIWDYYPEVRHGFRVTIRGDRPYGVASEAG